MASIKFDKNVGANRGKPRLYFQGGPLAAHGFTPGAAYLLTFEDNRILVQACADGTAGARYVSNKDGRIPIIDLNQHSTLMARCATVRVEMSPGRIVVTPGDAK